MRLTELEPRWVTFAHPADSVDFRIGLTFQCPHCKTQRLGVRFNPPIDPAGLAQKIEFPKGAREWQRAGDTFETLTLSPSIDASSLSTLEFAGHWHGYITNGEIV